MAKIKSVDTTFRPSGGSTDENIRIVRDAANQGFRYSGMLPDLKMMVFQRIEKIEEEWNETGW